MSAAEALVGYLHDVKNLLYENYKGLSSNHRWLLMRKLGRFETVRLISRQLSSNAAEVYSAAKSSPSLFENLDSDRVVAALDKDGLFLGINLPREIAQEILNFAKESVCYGNKKPQFAFRYIDRAQAEANYGFAFTTAGFFNTALLCPVIRQLESDPKLLEIAAKYLNTKPKHLGNQLWWSFPGESKISEKFKAAQMFHYDLNDYRSLKFFFYITDVDLTNGPHVCVRGSHTKKSLLHRLLNRRHFDKPIIDYYGPDKVFPIYGQAGFGFVEDTFCFHKGAPPQDRERLILQIEFAIRDYGMQSDRVEARSPKSPSP